MDSIHVVQLYDNELGIYKDAQVMNMVVTGFFEKANDNNILSLVIGGGT